MQQRQHKIGIDANQPIDNNGRVAARLRDPEVIAGTGAAWVRLNFVLGPWSGPGEPDWVRTYQSLVDQYLDQGMSVYGLIGHESVKSSLGLPDFFREHRDQTQDRSRPDRWIAEYVDNFAEIVKQFQSKIKIFESFNEPDDWHGDNRPWIHPTWFAVMLDQIYRKIKVELGLSDIKLISGPLQGLEVNRNEAPTKYLRQTYQYGRERLGWGQDNRPYPFDGVGYHIYIHEGYNGNWEAHERAVRQTYRHYINGMRQVIRQAEGNDKLLYISEMGWPSNADSQQEKEFQAKNVTLALDLLNSDPIVAVGIWFCAEDFAPGEKFYGLYQMGNPTAQGRKPAYKTFTAFCERLMREAPTARPQERRPPVTMTRPTTGQTIQQQITALGQQIAALYSQAGRSAPATPGGSIRQQIAQLANQLGALRPELSGQLNALRNSPLTQQLAQLGNYVAQLRSGAVPARSTSPQVTRPPTAVSPAVRPAAGPTIRQQIAALGQQIAALYSQSGRPAPATSGGSIRQQIAQLANQLGALRPELSSQLNALLNSPLTQQLAQLSNYIAQLRSGTTPVIAPPPLRVAPAGQTGPGPVAAEGTLSQQVSQLKTQMATIERQMQNFPAQVGATQPQLQTLQTQITQLQQYIQQLVMQQAQLQKELGALQTRSSAGAGLAPAVPAIASPQMVRAAPATSPPQMVRAAPSIQNLVNQLPRHPTIRFPNRSLNQIQWIIIQHTGNAPHIGADRIANYLVGKGRAGLTYHYFITDQAAIQQANELTTSTVHEAVVNIGFAGKFNETTPTPQQIEAGAQLIAWLLAQLHLSPNAVRGAKEVSPTQSPGAQWDSGARWGDQLRNRIQIYLNNL